MALMDDELKSRMWTPTRKIIVERLGELPNPTLAQLYEHAIDRIEGYSPTSQTAELDLMLIGHCLRELANGLPYYLGDGSVPASKKDEERAAVVELRNTLLDECDEGTFTASDGERVVAIPASVARAIERFRKSAQAGHLTDLQKTSLAVLGHVDETNPALIPWMQSKRRFVGFAHMNWRRRDYPERSEIVECLVYLENVLAVRLGYFFGMKASLSAALRKANACTSDGVFSIPSDDDVTEALSLLGNYNLRFVFYSGLRNPEWLALLRSKGAFDLKTTATESVRLSGWPEALYLRLMATVKPVEVASILTKAAGTKNPGIRLDIISIAGELPVDQSAKVVEEIIEWAEGGYRPDGYYWGEGEVFSLIKRLANAESVEGKRAAKKLFQACFMPRQEEEPYSRITALVSEHFYSEGMQRLESVISSFSPSQRRGIFSSFARKLLVRGRDEKASSFLIPSVRDAYAARSRSISNEVIYQLCVALRLCIIKEPEETVTKLRNTSNNPLVIRCALFAMRQIIEDCFEDDETQEPMALNPQVKKYLHEILLSSIILEDEYDPELYPLYAPSKRLGVITSEEIDNHLAKSYGEKLARIQRHNAESGELDIKSLEERARKWHHRVLSLVGETTLGVKGKRTLDELSIMFPNRKYRAEHIFEGESFVGPNSPLGMGEMLEFDSGELIRHLLEWHPTGEERFRLISHEGQGRELKQLIQAKPCFFQGHINRLSELRPAYQRAIVEGWASALSEGTNIPIDDTLILIDSVVSVPVDSAWDGDGDDLDDDFNCLKVKKAAARLIKVLIEKADETLSLGNAKTILDYLIRLIDECGEEDVDEEVYGEDAVTQALNSTRAISLLALVKWIDRFRSNADSVQKALSVLEQYLPSKAESRAVASAMGQSIPYLYQAAPDWVYSHYDDIFGGTVANVFQQIALTTLLVFYRPARWLYDLLAKAMADALRGNPEQYVVAFRSRAVDFVGLVGQWVYVGYVIGFVGDDDFVLAEWRSVADGPNLGKALKSICGSVRGADGVSLDILRRIGELWDYHSNHFADNSSGAALGGIKSLIKSGYFEASWWGPRLLRELDLNPGEIQIFEIRHELAGLAETDPDLAVQILSSIVKSDPNPRIANYTEIGRQVLNAVLEKNGGQLTEDALRCMDALGEVGCIDLDERLGLAGHFAAGGGWTDGIVQD